MRIEPGEAQGPRMGTPNQELQDIVRDAVRGAFHLEQVV